jgi:hypothetical protein
MLITCKWLRLVKDEKGGAFQAELEGLAKPRDADWVQRVGWGKVGRSGESTPRHHYDLIGIQISNRPVPVRGSNSSP